MWVESKVEVLDVLKVGVSLSTKILPVKVYLLDFNCIWFKSLYVKKVFL